MIIVKITGGLGNQMFQYAAGRRLSLLHQVPLKLDLREYAGPTHRKFDLDAFHVQYEPATEDDIRRYAKNNFLFRLRNRIVPVPYRRFYRERFFHYDRKFEKYPSDVYLKGYWQSEKYFKSIEPVIRREFTMKNEFIEHVSAISEKIQQENSVAVHIRKGDYQSPEALKMHGILPAAYYWEAIGMIKSKISNPAYYLFSDDEGWAKNFLQSENIVRISGVHSRTRFEDFFLMSQCRHNIIANSSFSWWAAWLNKNPGKIVMAPQKWFNKGPKDTQDLIPEGWILI
jgi:hypothetical protein